MLITKDLETSQFDFCDFITGQFLRKHHKTFVINIFVAAIAL